MSSTLFQNKLIDWKIFNWLI